MRTHFEHIHFVALDHNTKTEKWECVNSRSGSHLGLVQWYAPWRRYCYLPSGDCVYGSGCLNDIVTFIDGLMAARIDGREVRA